jgi:two-component system, cell cycle sensor histidine kinase and response regulator CckA
MTDHEQAREGTPGDAADLREIAEEVAREQVARSLESVDPRTSGDTGRILHELRVHQIELEMQNEELRRAQAEIEAARARYFEIYDLAPVGYVTLSEQGLILDANLTAASMLGVRRGALVKKPFSRFIFDADEDIWYLHRRQLSAPNLAGPWQAGKVDAFELRMVKPDGVTFWADLNAVAAHDPDGALVWRITLSDITDRKLAEGALQQQAARLRAILESAASAVFAVDRGGRYTAFNALHATRMRADRGVEIQLGRSVLDYIGLEEDRERARASFDRVMAGERFVETGLWGGEGDEGVRFYEHTYNPIVAVDGTVIGAAMFSQDLTERHRAEEKIRRSEARLLEAQRIGHVGNWERDLRNDELFWADETYRILGLSPDVTPSIEALLGAIDPADRELAGRALEATVKQREQFDLDLRIVRGGGSKGWVHAQAAVTCDSAGRPIRVFGTIQDISERKQMEEALVRAQRLEMAGTIAGQLAHDFNNLLTPIVAFPELIRMELPEGHLALEYVELIENAGEQMAAINQNLLALARRGHFSQEPISLDEVVKKALSQMASVPRTLVVELDLAADCLPVMGSAAQLGRVISNLVANARDAVLNIGVIGIKTENVYLDREQSGYERVAVGEYVRLRVEDTGCGMSAETQKKIFDPFFTTKTADRRRGTGLGLSIVQSIVRDHNGVVDVASQEGTGTTFSLYFPVCREAVKAGENNGGVQTGDESLLIVDDDAIQRDVAGRLLASVGYSVDSVSSGEEALSHLRERPVDLILLDMVLPGGMDGLETYERIREMKPRQKVIVVSGYAETDRVRKAQALGAGVFLAKPYTRQTLTKAVRDALDRKSPTSAAPTAVPPTTASPSGASPI